MAFKKEVMDGNTAAAYISYAFTETAAIFPITPSSPMAEYVDEWAKKGKKNVFGQRVEVAQLQSEAGAAGAMHGALAAGALASTYTASQGLLLMIPNIYKISGELLPGVFHVSARTLSVHGLSIFGDHSDVMACRQTGAGMLVSSNPQEVMDLGAVAHLSAIKGTIPFIHFFDGFRTSHEMQKIEVLDYEDIKKLVDFEAVNRFRKRSLNPERPTTRGTTQNGDIFFQQREAANPYYQALPGIVEDYMEKVKEITGRDYRLFQYYGAADAKYLVIAMGSVCDTVRETVDYLQEQGYKTGLLQVRLYRPFAAERFLKAIPESVERIAVLDRTKEPGSQGEPLYQDVCQAFYQSGRNAVITGGRYGLASKDTTPAMIGAVFANLMQEEPRREFTVGIEDDVTGLSLEVEQEFEIEREDLICCKLWGLGSDGTVGANKNSVKIVGNHTDFQVQAYFVYDSKKSGGLTQSHLRFGKSPIRAPYLVSAADFVACSVPSYLEKYDILKDLKKGGIFLLNTPWKESELERKLPARVKKALAEKEAQFYIIDALAAARELGLGERTNSILQSAFFQLVPLMPLEEARRYMEAAIETSYGKKGAEIVEKNKRAVALGAMGLHRVEVPGSWAKAGVPEASAVCAKEGAVCAKEAPPAPCLALTKEQGRRFSNFMEKVVLPMNRQEGDRLPVSAFAGLEDGSFPNGTAAFEKRGGAARVPRWEQERCIQCNRCSLVCPHGAIRPFLLTEGEEREAPESFFTKRAAGPEGKKYRYRIQVSPLDCTGCGSCAAACPAKEKALFLEPQESLLHEIGNWVYAQREVSDKRKTFEEGQIEKNVKYSQYARPLFEFSGACAGCGETPYLKLLTQLFGDRMYIANASGCSSAYGGSTPSTPYTVNDRGQGPAWGMSLFEDNAEYAYGMLLGAEKIRERLKENILYLRKQGIAQGECTEWLETMDNGWASQKASEGLVKALRNLYSALTDSGEIKNTVALLLKEREYLSKKSYWAVGGDGWAYDIGYGGLDHVLASGRDLNMLVLDTEVYSNTGGQASKATPTGAVSKFAAAGKRVRKKDLGRMAMSYGYVYVAQVAMGYDPEQTLKALKEAEAYPGPSLVIAYCPCIEHGIKAGMSGAQQHMKEAVEAGYWHLYRYNPLKDREGENPFTLDSGEPSGNFREFLLSENRYASLKLVSPEEAEAMYEIAEEEAKIRYREYRRLSGR